MPIKKTETLVARNLRLKREAKEKKRRQSIAISKAEQAKRAALRKKQESKRNSKKKQ